MNLIAQFFDAWKVARTTYPVPIATVIPDPDALARRALELAILDLEAGCGELGANNCGPDVERYVAPAKCPANWCAGSIGYWYERAANQLGIALPFKRSLGAKALGKNVAAVGRRFTDPREAKPGDLMIFDRGAKGSWMGHVAMVEHVEDHPEIGGRGDPLVHTVEGNAGPKVQRLHRGTLKAERFTFFASVRKG